MRFKSMLAVVTLTLGLAALGVPAQAQITANLKMTISHPWIVVNKTMPAGTYVFKMLEGSQQQQMTATNTETGEKAVFVVEPATWNALPHHSELIFDRMGDQQFLTHVYQSGARMGVAVQPSKEEKRLEQQGQKAVENTEPEQ
jgi:hypothetical protein